MVVGPIDQVANYALHTASLVVRGLAVAASGHPGVAIGWIALDLTHFPVLVAGTSMADLMARQYLYNRHLMSEIRKVPGVRRAILLTGGEYGFNGIVPRSRRNQTMMILQTDRELPESILTGHPDANWDPKWGTPIAVNDPSQSRLTLRLFTEGERNPQEWTVSLDALSHQVEMPAAIKQSWQSSVRGSNQKQPGWLKRTLTLHRYHPESPDRLRVDATLQDPQAGTVHLGTIAIGGGVERLVGVGLWPRLFESLHLLRSGHLPATLRSFAAKPLAVCDASLERLAPAHK